MQLLESLRDRNAATIAFKKDRIRKLKADNERMRMECDELIRVSPPPAGTASPPDAGSWSSKAGGDSRRAGVPVGAVSRVPEGH